MKSPCEIQRGRTHRQELLHLGHHVWLRAAVLHLVGDLPNLAIQLVHVSIQHLD